MPIANFLIGLCTNRVTVYITFSLLKPLYTALIAFAKDSILTNSLTSNSLERETGIRGHNLSNTAEQAAMVWECAEKKTMIG